ncbi:MAG: AzlD domain-containing protein [Chloroflexaceae bacterium]|nr:AzlD domain-containing protein [Chloroflexaceae bacterium]NJO07307.1 AzlD domain-containing protein [Chloroflexaceae bacterium]
MYTPLSLWLIISSIGLATYAMRLVFVVAPSLQQMPPPVRRALRYVPAAALAALIVPELVVLSEGVQAVLLNERLLAGTLAAAVAWRTRNVPLTIAVGMGSLWLLQALFSL